MTKFTMKTRLAAICAACCAFAVVAAPLLNQAAQIVA